MPEKVEPNFDLDNYKFHFDSPGLIDCFVKNGFVIVEEVFDKNLILDFHNFTSTQYIKNKSKFILKFPKKPLPSLGIAKHILFELKSLGLYEKIRNSHLFLDTLEKFLGPDLATIDSPNLWINDSDDSSSVTNKSFHQEIWTGANTDDINVWIPFQETVSESTLSLIPKSHYFGFLPNQNRIIVNPDGFKLPASLPLAPLKIGDVVFFHSLLLHKTAGRGKEVRYAASFLFTNNLTPTTRHQKMYSKIPLRTGPLTKIGIGLGNDYLSPLRTYGGKFSNDQSFDPNDLE